MTEFCFTIPVLLMIAGSTIDISRYMRFLQITTFVSQEAGSEIYQKCSDLTIYDKPNLNSDTLTVDKDRTLAAIAMCTQRIQNQAQLVLNKSLGRSILSSDVFRANIEDPSTTPDCAQSDTTIDRVSINASIVNGFVPETGDSKDFSFGGYHPTEEDCDKMTGTTITIRRGSSGSYLNLGLARKTNIENLGRKKLEFNQNSGLQYVTNSGPRTLITRQSMCTRGRVVAVEVAYDFDPIVKFLPEMIVKLDENGNQREISVF